MVVVRILLCTRNGEAFLDAQLASYLDQTHTNWRLWISDDGSTDATQQIIARFAQDHPHKVERILAGPQAGGTQNFLSLLCHPDLEPGFVALSDQDDIWREDKLERAVSALSRGETNTARAYAAGYLVCDARMQRRSASAPWPRTPSLGNALLQNVMPGHTIVLNPAALASVRLAGVQDVPYQDWWIYLVATACGMQVILDPEHVIQYRQHGANVLGAHRGRRAAMQRLSIMTSGKYANWIEANLHALGSGQAPLTPEARALISQWSVTRARWGPQRVAAFRRMGLHRQSRADTALCYLAAGLGLL